MSNSMDRFINGDFCRTMTNLMGGMRGGGKSIFSDHMSDAILNGSLIHGEWMDKPITNNITIKCPSPTKLEGIIKTWIVMSNVACGSWDIYTPRLRYYINMEPIETTLELIGRQELNGPGVDLTLSVMGHEGGIWEGKRTESVPSSDNASSLLYKMIINAIAHMFDRLFEALNYGHAEIKIEGYGTLQHWREYLRLMPKE